MGRHCHDCAGAVSGKHVIGDPNWNFFLIYWIYGVRAGEHAGFFFGEFRAFEVAFARGVLAIILDGLELIFCCDFVDEVVFGGEHHVGRVVKTRSFSFESGI